MILSDKDKLILLMLAEIHEHLKIEPENATFLTRAIVTDNTWSIPWKFSGVCTEDHETPEVVSQVTNILEMYVFLEAAYNSFNAAEKERVRVGAEPFGDEVYFRGFDGNNEGEYLNAASFFVEDLRRFTQFSGRDLNSHVPMVPAYNRMLQVFNPIKPSLFNSGLSVDQLIAILKVKPHRD